MAWEDIQAAAQRAFTSVYYGVGNTYQQVLTGGLSGASQSQPEQIAASYSHVNPEYAQMEMAYVAQEYEREGIDKEYEAWRDAQPEYQKEMDIEPDR